jgi:peptidoglycan-N-acetylglucosamine deacetylase
MWWIGTGLTAAALVHTVPLPFLLEAFAGERGVWHMPRTDPPTVYLTYDDGPNRVTTPDLLDVLARERVHATFFVIPEHITPETAGIVRQMFAGGHAVALHSGNRWELLRAPGALAAQLTTAADRIEMLAGSRPCRAFRPHGGWRSSLMYAGLRRIDYRLVGWGWMLWDVDPLRARTADRIVARIEARVRAGDIIVMHDGDYRAPDAAQTHTVQATARLITLLRARGFAFGTVCSDTTHVGSEAH